MRRPRFYVPKLAAGAIELPLAEAYHALRVLRLKEAEAVELFDGRGAVARGRLKSVAGAAVIVQAEAPRQTASPRPRVELAFAAPKGKRMDWLLEKAIELSVAALRPVVFERSVAGRGAGSKHTARQDRWLSHCIAAAKQCGLNWLPTLAEPQELDEFLSAPPGGLRLVGDCSEDAVPLAAALSGAKGTAEGVVILIGPEGGLGAAERQAVAEAGFVSVRLGETTLRVETAAVALLAGVQALSEFLTNSRLQTQ